MRIAIVLNTSWNIYNFRKGLAQTLLNEGHEVIAIAPPDKYSDYLIEMGCIYHPIKLDNKGSNPLRDLSYMHQLYKIYKKTKPDAIIQYTIKPNIYGTLAAIPLKKLIINNVCGLGTVFIRNGLTSRIAKWMYRFSFRFPNKVLFHNQDDLHLFLEKKLVRKNISEVVPGSGIPLEKFNPGPFKRNQTFTFLMIARLLYDKGIVEYFEAAKNLKEEGLDVKFQLLGQLEENRNLGISSEILQEWIKLGIIEYLGTSDQVENVIAEADCVVLPSYREGMPRALLEAAAMAKPLIASDIAGCKQTIEEKKNGFLCKVKDALDLARAMKVMYNLAEEELQQMGQYSRKKVEEEFDEKIVIQKYLDIINSYHRLLRKKSRKKRLRTSGNFDLKA